MRDFMIFACFTRSYDESHIKNGRVHLISSAVFSKIPFNGDLVYDRFKEQAIINGGDVYYVIVIVEKGTVFEDGNVIKKICRKGVEVLFISLEDLIGGLNCLPEMELFDKFFGNRTLSNKDFNLLDSSKCLFIFTNEIWANIVLKFKLNGIDISGGNISKRHLLSSVDASLKDFLNIFYNNNLKLINKEIVYYSFKDAGDIMSSSIPLKFYNRYCESIDDIISNSKNDEEFNIKIKSLPIIDNIMFDNNEIENFIFNNVKSSIGLLRKYILKNYEEEVELLKSRLTKVVSDIKSGKYKLNEIEDAINGNVSTVHMSNKSKKNFKKERKIWMENPSIKSDLEKDVANLQNVEEYLNNKLLNKFNEYEKMREIVNSKSISELNDIYLKEMDKLKRFKNKDSKILKMKSKT